jgi:hypothetical protein
VLDLGEIKV